MYELPFACTKGIESDRVYLFGGYHSIADGCKPWGSSLERNSRFIGDIMGWAVLDYLDGTQQRVPLVFGYTLWFKSVWQEGGREPFTSEEDLMQALNEALYLYGAIDSREECILGIHTGGKRITGIKIEPNSEKEGEPVFTSAAFECAEPVRCVQAGGIPEHVTECLDKINRRLLIFPAETDLQIEKGQILPPEQSDYKVNFYGFDAPLLNGIFHANINNLLSRIDTDGFIHTSFKEAPSWRYEGFGPWVDRAEQYYWDFYSRDGARAIMTLRSLGRDCTASARYAAEKLKFFRDNKLTMGGKQIPGHFTMILNRPTFYHDLLTGVGWYTQYTPERFGPEYKNLGNPETDGHGLMMMALSKALDGQELLETADEAAEYIMWCLENPEQSLAKNGLLYGETEATQGTDGYSLYANLPCALGMYAFSKAAEDCGQADRAQKWLSCARGLFKAAVAGLSDGKQWASKTFGYYHDCAPAFMSDIFGFDIRDMPPQLVELSQTAYETDISRSRHIPYDGSGGLGYNTSMRLQNALLLDRTEDSAEFLRQLARKCYAPKLPFPFLVTEGSSYSRRLKAIRRQGDVGNLVQLAEVLKCLLILLGVSLKGGELKIMPRYAEGFEIEDFPVECSGAAVSLASKPIKNGQNIFLRLKRAGAIKSVSVRFGPFKAEQLDSLELTLNGLPVQAEPYLSGDAWWCFVKADIASL